MSAALVEKAPAKINLTLRVLGRRDDGYHELESLVAFADLADTLTLQPGDGCTLDLAGPFAGASGPNADNLVLKAVAALRQRIGGLKAGRFLLGKSIPVSAGLGGGSADAAAALRLMARVNGLASDDKRLTEAASSVGADVPVCFDPRPRVMRGIGELLSAPLDLPPLPAVLVNPGVALPTRAVFAKFTAPSGGSHLIGEPPPVFEALVEFLKHQANDLTPAAIACDSVVAEVLAALDAVPRARLVRMSGSGATCFALFASRGEAAAAAWLLQADRPDWCVSPVMIG